MGIFYNLSKIMKLVPSILMIDGKFKQHKMMPQKDFYQSLKGISWFWSILCMHFNWDFDKIFSRSLLWTAIMVHDELHEELIVL